LNGNEKIVTVSTNKRKFHPVKVLLSDTEHKFLPKYGEKPDSVNSEIANRLVMADNLSVKCHTTATRNSRAFTRLLPHEWAKFFCFFFFFTG
jgi:hypothetical protein